MWTRPSDRAPSYGACGQALEKLALAHRLPTLGALAPTSSPLLQQRFMTEAPAPTPTASQIAPSSQAIRLRNKPANCTGDSTRQTEKQHRDNVRARTHHEPDNDHASPSTPPHHYSSINADRPVVFPILLHSGSGARTISDLATLVMSVAIRASTPLSSVPLMSDPQLRYRAARSARPQVPCGSQIPAPLHPGDSREPVTGTTRFDATPGTRSPSPPPARHRSGQRLNPIKNPECTAIRHREHAQRASRFAGRAGDCTRTMG